MRKFGLVVLLFLSITQVFAAGGTTHMYIAQQARDALPTGELKNILTQYQDAFLVGSNFPDTGYLPNAHYGELTHWDPFINAYVNHLHQNYVDPKVSEKKLIAFLMGIATHRISDELWHWTFIPKLAREDFAGDHDKAHEHADTGFDIILGVDKQRMFVRPTTWWIPKQDLLAIYQAMGHEVSAQEITTATNTYAFIMDAEHTGTPLLYPYYKLRMTWGNQHYQDDQFGGLAHIKRVLVPFLLQTWEKI